MGAMAGQTLPLAILGAADAGTRLEDILIIASAPSGAADQADSRPVFKFLDADSTAAVPGYGKRVRGHEAGRALPE